MTFIGWFKHITCPDLHPPAHRPARHRVLPPGHGEVRHAAALAGGEDHLGRVGGLRIVIEAASH